jgi:spore maturation protein CgeB
MLLDTVLAALARHPQAPARPRRSETLPLPASDDGRRLSILYVGPKDATCLQRAEALRSLGHRVHHVRSGIPRPSDPSYPLLRVAHRIKRHPDLYFANSRLLRVARRRRFDLVWIDKGLAIRPRTLDRLRALLPHARLVAYSPDDMSNPGNQSRRYLDSVGRYDVHVTTKSYNVPELEALGARHVIFVDNAYDPAIHRPMELSEAERRRFAADVGFVGTFELDRAEWAHRLAEAGIPVTVRGPGWSRFKKTHPLLRVHDEYLNAEDYPRAVSATRINLAFLCKANRDRQTQRSAEIPACRAFMLAERTDEHARLYREGQEAEFFGSFDELVAKCRHYLAHEDERRNIAIAGYRRCVLGGYSNAARLARVLEQVQRQPRLAPEPAPTPRSPAALTLAAASG